MSTRQKRPSGADENPSLPKKKKKVRRATCMVCGRLKSIEDLANCDCCDELCCAEEPTDCSQSQFRWAELTGVVLCRNCDGCDILDSNMCNHNGNEREGYGASSSDEEEGENEAQE